MDLPLAISYRKAADLLDYKDTRTIGRMVDEGKLRKRAGLPEQITIHSLRHTAIHLLEDSGAPLSVVQAFAGHSAATMTAHYADHADLEAVRRALQKLA